MIINGYDVYRYYIRAKLHFSDKNFDMSKMGTKPLVKTFEERKDRYSFDKIAKSQKKKFKMYIIANLLEDPHKYVRDFSDEPFVRMNRIISNLKYFFSDFLNRFDKKEDLISYILPSNGKVECMNDLKQKKIDLEIICILNNIFHLVDRWKEDEIFSFIYDNEIMLIEKYSIFFTDYTDECKKNIINKYDL
jgi:hypothetical protein